MATEWMASEDLQRRHAWQILRPAYAAVWEDFQTIIGEFDSESSKEKPKSSLPILLRLVSKEIDRYENFPIAECFSDVTEGALAEFYEVVLDEVVDRVFRSPPVNEEGLSLCRRLGILYSVHVRTRKLRTSETPLIPRATRQLIFGFSSGRSIALHRHVFSETLSGFVFAGFGVAETFPSLMAYHTDGIIAGKLKTKSLLWRGLLRSARFLICR